MLAPEPKSIEGLAPLVPSFSLVVEDLAHESNDDIKARALAAFPSLALWALRDARDAKRLLENLGHWGAAFAEAARTPHGVTALAQLVRYIALVTDDLHFDAFRAKMREQAPEAEQAAMTIAEQMRREVQVEERSSLLRKLLARKPGGLTAADEEAIAEASAEQLERYIERALKFRSSADVFAD